MESTPYMNSVTSARALLLGEEEALVGATTISLETQQDLQGTTSSPTSRRTSCPS